MSESISTRVSTLPLSTHTSAPTCVSTPLSPLPTRDGYVSPLRGSPQPGRERRSVSSLGRSVPDPSSRVVEQFSVGRISYGRWEFTKTLTRDTRKEYKRNYVGREISRKYLVGRAERAFYCRYFKSGVLICLLDVSRRFGCRSGRFHSTSGILFSWGGTWLSCSPWRWTLFSRPGGPPVQTNRILDRTE